MSIRLLDDEVLVEQAKNGNHEAFDALFHRYLETARGEARQRCPAAEDDIVQESFLRAYLNLHELREPAKFAPWLRTIVRRACVAAQRAHRPTLALDEEGAPVPPHWDEKDELRQAIALLPPQDRGPLYLCGVLGLDTRSAAKAMGLSPGAFRVRLHRLRHRVRVLVRAQTIEENVVMAGQDLGELPGELVADALARPDDYAAWYDDWPTFRRTAELAHRLDPEALEPAVFLGRKLASDGEYQAAARLLRPLWGRTFDPWCGLTVALCLDYLGRREEAVRWYARVLALPGLDATQHGVATAGIEAPQAPKRRPAPPEGLVEMAATRWRATASDEHLSPGRAFDGDARTHWSPVGDQQAPGMWFRLDLGETVAQVAGIWLDDDAGGQSIYRNSQPRHCLLSVSVDGEWWKRVGEWRWRPNQYLAAWWEPVTARYLLLEQTAHHVLEWWCIYGTHVYRAT